MASEPGYRSPSCGLCWPLVVLCAFAPVCPADSLHDGPRADLPAGFHMLKQPWYTILAASVVELDPGPFCHTNPPAGVFRVDQVLRGHARTGSVRMTWELDHTDPDNYVPWDESMPGSWQRTYFLRPHTEAWNRTPMAAPTIGEKLIVFANRAGRAFTVREVFAYTESNAATVLANMGPTDRHPLVQGLLFHAILVAPWLALAMFIASVASRRFQTRAWLSVQMLISVLVIPLYLLYESGNRTKGLRADLVILFPIMGIGVGVFVAAIATSIWRRVRTRKRQFCPPPLPPTV